MPGGPESESETESGARKLESESEFGFGIGFGIGFAPDALVPPDGARSSAAPQALE